MSALRLMCDTNVILDIFTQRMPSECSQKLLNMYAFGDAELWLSAHSFTDMFYIMRKLQPNDAVQKALKNSLRWLKVCDVNEQDIRRALELHWADFEDCIVNVGAEKIKADFLITRNTRDFTQSECIVLTPREFFEFLERDRGLTYDEVEF